MAPKKINVLLAENDKKYKKACNNVGIQEFMEKPLSLEKCEKILEKFKLLDHS